MTTFLSQQRPSPQSVRALAAALEPGRLEGCLRPGSVDDRISRELWLRMVVREVAQLVRWSARRGREPLPEAEGVTEVTVLLPRHGLLIHGLKRALPSAVCGIPTRVSAHAEQFDQVVDTVETLTSLAALPTERIISEASAPMAVRLTGPSGMVLLTGARRTAETIAASTTTALLGATGSCAIGLAPNWESAAGLRARLSRHAFPGSCTNLGDVFVGDPSGDTWCQRRDGVEQWVSPPSVLSEVHPSVILASGPDCAPLRVHGYTVLSVDADAEPTTTVGFGADPVWGWPGDYNF